jgi:hypothetical protein
VTSWSIISFSRSICWMLLLNGQYSWLVRKFWVQTSSGRPTTLTEVFCHSLQANTRTVPQISPRLFCFTPFPIHYSLIILSFNVIYQLLTDAKENPNKIKRTASRR